MRNRQGFTLLELMIVVIILAILVIIAIPLYTKAVERGRMSEAYSKLGAVRNAELRYYQQKGAYTSSYGDLDIDNPNTIIPNQQVYFTYGNPAIGVGRPPSFTVIADRNDVNRLVPDYTVTIYNNGDITATGP